MDTDQGNNMYSDEITWGEVFHAFNTFIKEFRQKWKIVAPLVLMGMLYGYLSGSSQKPVYKAEIKFLVDNGESAVSGSSLSAIASSLGISSSSGAGGIFQGENLIKYMQSNPILEKTLLSKVKVGSKDSTLINYYIDIKRNNETFFKKSPYEPEEMYSGIRDSTNEVQNRFIKKVTEDFQNTLIIEKAKDWNVISAVCTVEDSVFPKLFLEQLINEITIFYTNSKTAKIRQNLEMLQHQSDSIQSILYSTMAGIAYNSDNDPNSIRPQTVRLPSQKKQLDRSILEGAYLELSNSLVRQRIDLAKEKPFIQIIESPLLPLESSGGRPLLKALLFGVAIALLSALVYFIFYTYRRMNATISSK